MDIKTGMTFQMAYDNTIVEIMDEEFVANVTMYDKGGPMKFAFLQSHIKESIDNGKWKPIVKVCSKCNRHRWFMVKACKCGESTFDVSSNYQLIEP